MTTASDLFATLTPGSTHDARGEAFDGDVVTNCPPGVTLLGATFIGPVDLYQPDRVTLSNCTFLPSLRMLGGADWRVTGCMFSGGVTMAQLNVGLDPNVGIRRGGCPTGWTVEDCTFEPLDGQGGVYPQGHQLYVLTTPKIDMGGAVRGCLFSGSPFGATIKLGGTGNYWRTEGVQGVVVEDCDIGGIANDVPEIVSVLTQGAPTRRVVVRNSTLRGDQGVRPGVTAIDGAALDLVDNRYPDGIDVYVRWYGWLLGLWQNESREAVAGRRWRGGLRMS